jgi:hypothetical protein
MSILSRTFLTYQLLFCWFLALDQINPTVGGPPAVPAYAGTRGEIHSWLFMTLFHLQYSLPEDGVGHQTILMVT